MKGANMNDDPKAASTQENIASHFDLADITDPAEREQLLMEELRRTQNALAKAKDEVSRIQRRTRLRPGGGRCSRSFARRLLDRRLR